MSSGGQSADRLLPTANVDERWDSQTGTCLPAYTNAINDELETSEQNQSCLWQTGDHLPKDVKQITEDSRQTGIQFSPISLIRANLAGPTVAGNAWGSKSNAG